jgi:hypothetical protein
MCSLVFVL